MGIVAGVDLAKGTVVGGEVRGRVGGEPELLGPGS